MLKKRIFYLSFLLLAFFKPFAQVNLQTGGAVFSLPMFSWQDDKSRLNSAVALSYNSGNGLKVNDVATNVGQGWNLIEGGVISRMQIGEPDDQWAYGSQSEQDITKYPAGILYASVPAVNGCPTALEAYPIYGAMNQLYAQHNVLAEDKQLDYFSFRFNGKVGMFVLDPTNIGVAHSIGDSKMKITFQQDAGMISQGIRTRITSFTIQDVDGLIYTFSVHGLTKVLRSNYCDPAVTRQLSQPKFSSGGVYHMGEFDDGTVVNPYIISNWYLAKIDDPLVNREITFTYNTLDINAAAGSDISYNNTYDASHSLTKFYALISHKISKTKTPEISSISFPDGHLINFNYGSQRVDMTGEQVLSSVDITYQGRYLSKYLLNTSYFIRNRYGTPITDYEIASARLCLRSVQKIGVDKKEDTPPYIFDYYMGSDAADDFVPPPFFYAKDPWGYYNGNSSTGYSSTIPLNSSLGNFTTDQLAGLCFMHTGVSGIYLNAKPKYAMNGLLKQIIYPTGGTLTYQYDQNTGIPSGMSSAINVGGVHVSQTSSTDGGNSNGCSNPISTLYNYVLDPVSNASSLWGIDMPANSMTTNTHYQPEWKSYHLTLNTAPFGECYWHFKYPGILSQAEAINLNNFQQIMNDLAPVLGILSTISTINDVANLIGASSPGFGTIAAVVIDVITGLVTVFVTCIGNQSRDGSVTVYYNSDLNAISPLPTQFKRVEVIENPGTIGKTVQEFTSNDDYPIWVQTNPALSSKQRFAPWAYGLPKRTAVYDQGNNIIKETINAYNFRTQYGGHCPSDVPHYERSLLLKQPIEIYSCKCLVKYSASIRSTVWNDPNVYNVTSAYQLTSNGALAVDTYRVYTGRAELDTTYERVYKQNSSTDYIETVTAYVYNDENYEPELINTKKSDGSFIQKNIYYTIDYVVVHGECYTLGQAGTTYGPLNTLVQNNIINLPVETSTMIIGADQGNVRYLSDKATIFSTLANGDIKPSAIIEGRFSQPAYRNSFWVNDYGCFSYYFFQPLYNPASPDYSFYKTTQTFAYDASGNLIGVKDEGNRQVASIYDYNDKYAVASVINADAVVDKPAYTSFETSSFGGWTFSGIPPLPNTTSFVTGSQSFNLTSSTNFSAPLNTAKTYTLSFWATNSNVAVGGGFGAILTKSGPTINGFTYYEYDITQGQSSISVSGNSTIDELRLYPKAARMSTVTYDPLIGKTAECDANNRISYYEYDNLGRLRFIKDEYRNILKMYEYNNVSAAKQNGCPGLYHNHLISEIFIKSNCGPGSIGSSVPVTVAANTYSSSLSQADADAQAENYLVANGQNIANTNGNCIQLFYNSLQSQTFTSDGCDPGYVGGPVTYTVPANVYYSTVSVLAANQMALDEITANGQAYANSLGHRVCTVSTDPYWEWLEGAASYCLSVNGSLPPHLFVFQTDINPNSPTYHQTRWYDMGPQDACPAGNYYNAVQSGIFVKNNCSAGYIGSTVTYTVAAGTYSSTVSQAAADQLAINDVNANGQTYANTHGTCTLGCSFSAYSGYTIAYSSISSSGGTANFTLVFYSTSGTANWSNSNTVATINGGCMPSVNRTLNITSNGATWEVIITPFGTVNVRLLSGTAPSGTATVSLSGSYSL